MNKGSTTSFQLNFRVVLIFIILIISLFLMIQSNMYTLITNLYDQKPILRHQDLHARVIDYCTNEFLSSQEGEDEELELRHLLINLRHGDRSAIHKLPNVAKLNSDNDPHFLINPKALEYFSKFQDFILSPIQGESQVPSNVAFNPLDKINIFTKADRDLLPGELTSKGFMQHIYLGELLHKKYKTFLSKVVSAKQVYIRSTNYNRTVQSVVAFIISFLPYLKGVEIAYHPNEENEIMHGIGLKFSSHVEGGGEREIKGQCAKASKFALKQRNVIYYK